MEAIPHGIVPHDALTTGATDHALVAQDFTVLATARAGAWLVIHREAQPKLADNNKLGAAEMETEGRKWRAVEPSQLLEGDHFDAVAVLVPGKPS